VFISDFHTFYRSTVETTSRVAQHPPGRIDVILGCTLFGSRHSVVFPSLTASDTRTYKIGYDCEISSSHGGEYDVQSCLLGYTAVYNYFRQSLYTAV
jgi:hypothetical protein